MKNETQEVSIEKMRKIVNWANFQNEDFNYKVKTISDWEKLFDYCEKEDIEFIDNIPYNDYYTYENNQRYMTEINKMLGYKLIQK